MLCFRMKSLEAKNRDLTATETLENLFMSKILEVASTETELTNLENKESRIVRSN